MKSIIIILLAVFASSNKVFEYESSNTIDVEVGETFQISLNSNPSTGFRWQLDTVAVKLGIPEGKEGGDFQAPPNRDIGSGGKQLFTFEAKTAGKEELVFHYKRPWESNSDTTAVVTINIH